jgi:3-deoxy-D-manno-octulosonic-acid transferase
VSAPADTLRAPGVWLHATGPDQVAVLDVLAEQIGDFSAAPEVIQTGTTGNPGPQIDDPRALDTFLDTHPVQMLVLSGSLLPVALIDRAHARGIAVVLVNATAPITLDRWRLMPGSTRSTLGKLTQIHAADAATANSVRRQVHGRTEVFETGRLARHAAASSCNAFELDAMRGTLGARPVWFAYDLPSVETDAAFLAHAHALRRAHRLLMILQPRDPERGAALAERARELGFVCARRALDEEIDEATQVYVADSEDDPGLFLRLAPVSFLGGSLTRDERLPSAVGAASLGSALIFGPHTDGAQRDFLDRLVAVGGARQIGVAPALGEALAALLTPDAGAVAALKAWTLATDGSDATYGVARAICDWMQLNRGRE